ncbi:MAG: ATP-binding protein [Acidobacteria bacterium]|nr:ATP-binding protein [Acidobacteriota bacterium]
MKLLDRVNGWLGREKAETDPTQNNENRDTLLRSGTTTLLDQLAPANFWEDYTCFQMGEVWGRVWFVYDLPPTFPAYKLYAFHGDVWMSQFIYPLNPAEIAPALRQKRTWLHGENLFDLRRGALTSYGRQLTLSATEEALARIEMGDETIYMLGWYLAVFAPDRTSLDRTSDRFEDTLRETGVQFYRASARQLDGVHSLLPLGADRLGHGRNMTAEALAQLFPFTRKTHFDPRGLPYGVHRHNGSWVVLDPFDGDLPNASSFILGQSGMGKSVYLKHLAEWALLQGHRVFVVDLENEFRTLAEELGGVYLDLKRRSKHKMNLLDLNPEAEDPIADGVSVLVGFMQVLAGEQLDAIESGVILPDAYLQTMAAAGITPDDPESWRNEPPLLSDLMTVMQTMPQDAAQHLAALLNQYAAGLYAEDFSRPTSVDIGPGNHNTSLVVFGLSQVRDTMLAVRLWQIQNYIWSRVLSGPAMRPTHVILDEGWHLLKFEGMGQQLGAMARRFRKHYAALHIATQQVADLAMSPDAQVIRDNAGTAILFGQSLAAAERLAPLFGLNALETGELPRLGKGDAILIRKIAGKGDVHIPIYIPLPPHRQALYTTDPRERDGENANPCTRKGPR